MSKKHENIPTQEKKFIKFVKDHTSGTFGSGQIVPVDEAAFKVWTKSEFAEKSNVDEYNEYMQKKQEKLLAETKEAREKHQEKLNAIVEANKKMAEASEDEDIQDAEEVLDTLGNDLTNGSETSNKSEDGSEDIGEGKEDIFHTLTKEDVEENPTLTEGLKEGDEIEVDSEGTWLLGEDDKLIVKEN
jgi:hypothetical protein